MNQQTREPLFTAAQQGKVAEATAILMQARQLLQAQGATDAGMNALIRDITPLLWIAACNDHGSIVSLLLEQGANADHGHEHRRTALWAAAATGSVSAATVLLGAKAAVDQADERERSPLFIAAKRGMTDTVHALLGAKAAVNQADERDRSPLFIAAKRGMADTVRALLGAKAAVDQATDDGMTALSVGAQTGCVDTVRLLVNSKANMEPAPAGLTHEEGDWSVIHEDVMLFAGDYNEESDGDFRSVRFANSPLWLAAMQGHKDIVKLLVHSRADIHAKDTRGSTALWAAAANQEPGIISILLAAKADPSAENKGDVTPLHMAALSGPGSEPTVKLLLAAKANPDANDDEGYTPVLHAIITDEVQRPNIMAIKALLAAKADLKDPYPSYLAPLVICLKGPGGLLDHLQVADLLVEHKAEVDPASRDRISILRSHLAPLAEGGEQKRARLTK